MSGKNCYPERVMKNLSEAVNRIRLDNFKKNCLEIFSSVENVIPDFGKL